MSNQDTEHLFTQIRMQQTIRKWWQGKHKYADRAGKYIFRDLLNPKWKKKIVAYDPFLTEEKAQQLGVELVDLHTLLARADFISIHTPPIGVVRPARISE